MLLYLPCHEPAQAHLALTFKCDASAKLPAGLASSVPGCHFVRKLRFLIGKPIHEPDVRSHRSSGYQHISRAARKLWTAQYASEPMMRRRGGWGSQIVISEVILSKMRVQEVKKGRIPIFMSLCCNRQAALFCSFLESFVELVCPHIWAVLVYQNDACKDNQGQASTVQDQDALACCSQSLGLPRDWCGTAVRVRREARSGSCSRRDCYLPCGARFEEFRIEYDGAGTRLGLEPIRVPHQATDAQFASSRQSPRDCMSFPSAPCHGQQRSLCLLETWVVS